jgi:hypothetical protein
MTSTLPRRTAAVTALAVTAFSGVALAGAAVSSAAARAHTSLSIRAAFTVINPGASDTISGDLRSRSGNTGGHRVALFSKASGATSWTKSAVNRTGRGGHVGFGVTPSTNTRYRLSFFGNKRQQGSRSGVVAVRIRNTTSLTIAVTSKSINPGQSDTVNGVLSLDGAPLVGDTVNLLGHRHNAKFTNLGSGTTASDGSVSFSVTPPATMRYVLVFKQTSSDAGARSAGVTVHVRTSSSLSIRARTRKHGREVISGDLRGGGHALSHRRVMLQDRPSGTSTWTTVKTKRTGHGGGIGFSEPAPTASEDYQLVFAGGSLYEGCQSGVVTVTVAS